jgi:secondary thiamine-phosphate synthase enzyme
MIKQFEIKIPPHKRGFHLISNYIFDKLPNLTGIVHVFIKHTSASLTINENADYTVREDFETHFNKMVPESANYFKHTIEGPDDMTSHIKSSLLGSSISFPIKNGTPQLGIWQGIFLCEHRNNGGSRNIIITVYGED